MFRGHSGAQYLYSLLEAPQSIHQLVLVYKKSLEEKNITVVMETILKRSSLFQPLLLRCCIRFIWGDFISLIVVGVQECGTRKDEHRKDNYPKDTTNMICVYMMVIISA